jgi:hypothetical protein
MDVPAAATQRAEEKAKAELELLKLRYDFAWKHFDFHAKQRTTMFQYFVTIMPLIVGAYFYFFRDKPITLVAYALSGIAALGFLLSLAFWMFDVRNRHLYGISEENLRLLEQNYLYKEPLGSFRGIITTEREKYGSKRGYWFFKFRFWMALIYLVTTAGFALLAFSAVASHKHWFGWTLSN